MKVLLVSPDPVSRETMAVTVASLERRAGSRPEFLEARNGEDGVKIAWRERPDVIVADEIASRMGAFALARDLRGAEEGFAGAIVILLDRRQDTWLAKWSGADAWFVKPVDPFALAQKVEDLVATKEMA